MTVNKRQDGSVDLMVSQPGGTFVTLLDRQSFARGAELTAAANDKKSSQVEGCVQHPCLNQHPPALLDQLEALASQPAWVLFSSLLISGD